MMILRAGAHDIYSREAWRRNDISLECVDSGREALEFLRLYDYDLMLVDWDLPDMPATELLRIARAMRLNVPAIVIGLDAPPLAAVKALDAGADDFVEPSCGPREIVARIHAVVRRNFGHAASLIRVGDIELNLDHHEVKVCGHPMQISRKEFGVLELLFLKQRVVVSKPMIVNHLYRSLDEPGEKAIDVIICRLRKRLDLAGVPDAIRTIWGVGYILGNATVLEPLAA